MTQALNASSLTGVFPVLPTPFDANGQIDLDALRRLARYLIACRVDGMTFPGVASEVAKLSEAERVAAGRALLEEVGGAVPVVIGISAGDSAAVLRLAQDAAQAGAAALMVAAPPDIDSVAGQIKRLGLIAQAVPSVPLMLQNVPAPVGAGLEPEAIVEILEAVPAVRYVKEETLPSGQRLSAIRAQAPATLIGVLGGAGGRYITDELRRGACGTMPAIELAEVHVALFEAHREGDADSVRRLFTRMLPVLNIQAVFRWSLTKYVLKKRGLIAHEGQRMAGPLLDARDREDVDAFMQDMSDLLLPQRVIDGVRNHKQEAAHGTA